MKHPVYTIIIIILISITFCTDNPTNNNPEDQLEKIDNNLSSLVKIENVNEIDIGGTQTNFRFRVIYTNSDDSLLLQNRKVRWDYDSDGIFDTEWIETDSTNKVFSEVGKHNITAKILFDENKVGICSITVYSQPVFDLMKGDSSNTVHEMCYSYNEEKVFFAWGGHPHHIYSMGKYGNNIKCISCNLQSDNCRHYPVASPNGKYLSYLHNSKTQLLNLETSEKTVIENASNTTNSFTSDSKYYLTNIDNEFHSINLETKKDSIIINNIRHFSVIPNENKIAYLMYDVIDPDWPPKYSNVRLSFYDLENNKIISTFDNIPTVGDFQVLTGSEVIYFTKEHILYFLESGNSYRINANEFKIYAGWPSAITKDGSEVLFSVNKGMIKISLPTDLQ